MPTIQHPKVYCAAREAAAAYFRTPPSDYSAFFTTLWEGDGLYRYVSYRNKLAQMEAAGRTIWTSPEQDTANRWTGFDGVSSGNQGLYLSLPHSGAEQTHFAELEYYQKTEEPDTRITYFQYTPGEKSPREATAMASELRSLFLFTVTRNLKGFDMRLHPEDARESPVRQIFQNAKQENQTLFEKNSTLDDWYLAPDDASFTRAVGNACLEAGFDFFAATSVRDRAEINIVLKGEHTLPHPALAGRGRITFLVEEQKEKTSVYTIEDLIYNNSLENSESAVCSASEKIQKWYVNSQKYM